MFIVSELCVANSEVVIVAVIYNKLDAISIMNSSAGKHSEKNTSGKSFETMLVSECRAEVYSRNNGWLSSYKVLDFVYEINEFVKEAHHSGARPGEAAKVEPKVVSEL